MEPIKKLFQAKVFYEYGQKKSELDALQDEFLKNIPDKIRPYVKVKDRVGEILVIEVANNAVGHKIKIAVQNPNLKRKANKISILSINQMKNLSKEISDSPLKTYLKKIFQNK